MAFRLFPGRYSTNLHLFGLVAAVVVPLLGFAAFVLMRYVAVEQSRIQQESIRIATQTGVVVDAELRRLSAKLEGLRASSALADDDLAQLHAEAKSLVSGQDELIVLRDFDRRQLFNTSRPYGTALPPAVPIQPEEKAFLDRGQPTVSDVYSSPLSGEPRIAVAVPVQRDTVPAYILAITVPTTRIRDALLPAVPDGWIVGVGDRHGAYVARSLQHEDVSGKPGLPEYIQQVVGRSGTFTSPNFEGKQLLAGFFRSDFSSWFFTANIPLQTVQQPLRDSLVNLAMIGAAALLLSGALAAVFSRGIVSATAGLADRARRIGEGKSITPLTSNLSEFAIVGDALVGASTAITERVQDRERTIEREALLASIFDAVGVYVGVVEKNGGGYRFVVANQATSAIFGRRRRNDSLVGIALSELMPESADLLHWLSLCDRASAATHPIIAEFSLPSGAGGRRMYLGTFTAIPAGPNGRSRVALTAMDITERKRSEEQRQLLVNELNHRVKNSLTVVQSIASQTLRSVKSIGDARVALSARLVSLARTHDVLTRENWEGADLDDLISDIREPYGGDERVAAHGPAVRVTPARALTLSLVLQELMANSAKYGAMSVEGGRIDIRWNVGVAAGGRRLSIRFEESGGPVVAQPTHRGFGSRLFAASFASAHEGSITLDYRPSGLVCTIEAAL